MEYILLIFRMHRAFYFVCCSCAAAAAAVDDADFVSLYFNLSFSHDRNLQRVSAIDFHLKKITKVLMFEVGYRKMIIYLNKNNNNNNKNTMIGKKRTTATTTAAAAAAAHLTCVTPACNDMNNCTFLRNMKLQAIEEDNKKLFNSKNYYFFTKIFSIFTFGLDPSVCFQLIIFFFICGIVSQIITQSRNGIHKILVENYSGTRTIRCEHCLRSWMPSELPAR